MLWLVATAAFMQMLDTTIVNTALPSMATGLGPTLGGYRNLWDIAVTR